MRTVLPRRPVMLVSALLLVVATSVAAQKPVAQKPPAKLQPGAQQSMPALPPLRADSPADSLVFADRRHVSPPESLAASLPAGAPPLQKQTLSKSLTGTGYKEPIEYRLPVGYDPAGGPYPLLVAYHGFGSSPGSVALQSELDELCAARSWIYMAPTGLDDKLFGSEPCLAHVDAAIGWMLDQFAVDPDRISMVGFSMGAGVCLEYAARRRDPDGIMIAAVGAVSGGYDHVLGWLLDPAVRPWLEHPMNFGGPPGTELFGYQRASGLHLDTSSYLPLPGSSASLLSNASNLGGLTVRLAWDVDDPLSHVPTMGAHMQSVLLGAGASVSTRVVSGTPSPHSWAVLDAPGLMDAFEGLTVERHPANFAAVLSADAQVSWAELHQRQPGGFSWMTGQADPAARQLTLSNVSQAELVDVFLDQAGLADAWPLRVTAHSVDGQGFTLRLRGGSGGPGWFEQIPGGAIPSGWELGPDRDMLALDVPAGGSIDVIAMGHSWQAWLAMAPDPALPGEHVSLSVDGPAGPAVAWLILAAQAQLVELPGTTGPFPLLTPPWGPAVLLPLPLDGAGDISVGGDIPADATLSGARIFFQTVLQAPGGGLVGTSNPWAFDIG